MAKAKKNEQIVWVAAGAIFAAGLYWVISTSRFFTPSVRYQVRRREGDVEIRDYPDLAVAETAREQTDNRAFNRLFRYLEGANSTSRKISMTAPVLLTRAPNRSSMSFIMPEEIAPPEPRDAAVEVNALPACRYAALRFHGWLRPCGATKCSSRHPREAALRR